MEAQSEFQRVASSTCSARPAVHTDTPPTRPNDGSLEHVVYEESFPLELKWLARALFAGVAPSSGSSSFDADRTNSRNGSARVEPAAGHGIERYESTDCGR